MSSYNNRLSQPIALHRRSGGWESRTEQPGSRRKTFLRGHVQRAVKWHPAPLRLPKPWQLPDSPTNPYGVR